MERPSRFGVAERKRRALLPPSLPLLLLALLAAPPAGARAAAEAAAAADDPSVCLGVRGLCALPLRDVYWLGTHNSLAVAGELSCGGIANYFANQAVGAVQQLQAGARVLNLDADLRAGEVVFTHSLCANGKTTPASLFDAVGAWLAARPSETVVLHFDDNGRAGDAAAEVSMRRAVVKALAASRLGPLVYTGKLSAATRLADVRGKAVVVFDAGQWGLDGADKDGSGSSGGEDVGASSRGLWAKAWAEGVTSEGTLVQSPRRAASTRARVAATALSRLAADPSRCGAAFRSLALASGDFLCSRAADLGTCQLALLAAATNAHGHLADVMRRSASTVCGSSGSGGSGGTNGVAPGANVLFLDFFPPSAAAAAAAAAADGAPLPAAALVRDLNRAAVLGFKGCSWGPAPAAPAGSGGGSAGDGGDGGSQLTCPGAAVPGRRLALRDDAPANDGAAPVVVEVASASPLEMPADSAAPPAASAAAAPTPVRAAEAAAASGAPAAHKSLSSFLALAAAAAVLLL